MAFRKPQAKKRFKILLFGESGIGKTTTAIKSPRPVVYDMEDGTGHYGDIADFIVEDATDPDEVVKSIETITKNASIDIGDGKVYKPLTLVLDPIHIWELNLTQKLLDKRIKETRDPEYKVTLEDYQILKNKKKRLMVRLMAVDFNVIVCARVKPLYASGEIMKKIGIAPDCDEQWLGYFDTILYLYRDPGTKKRMAVAYKKDRTNKFPSDAHGSFKPFEFTYEAIADFLKDMDFESEVDATKTYVKDIKYEVVKNFETEFNGEKVKTAGVTGEDLTVILQYYSDAKLKAKFIELMESLADVSDPMELTHDMAVHLISEMEKQ